MRGVRDPFVAKSLTIAVDLIPATAVSATTVALVTIMAHGETLPVPDAIVTTSTKTPICLINLLHSYSINLLHSYPPWPFPSPLMDPGIP